MYKPYKQMMIVQLTLRFVSSSLGTLLSQLCIRVSTLDFVEKQKPTTEDFEMLCLFEEIEHLCGT